MPIKTPIITEIAYQTWCINEFGMDTMFLLAGEERALLIDCGTGLFDLPALVSSLTDKPLTVALTHGHVDHAGGAFQFPQVCLHPDDIPMLSTLTDEARRGYAAALLAQCDGLFAVTTENVLPSRGHTDWLPLREGEIIELGNRPVAVYETPGHTPGGLSFLDRRERIIFTGDACNMNTLMALGGVGGGNDRPKSTIRDLLATARKIEALHPHYDRNYNGHVGYAAMVDARPMPESLTRDAIELCEGLLSGRVVGQRVENPFSGSCLLARNRTMQIQYSPEQLR